MKTWNRRMCFRTGLAGVLGLVVFLGSAQTAAAQQQDQERVQRRVESPEKRAETLKESLGMDDAQTEKARIILTDQSEKLRKAREASGGDRSAMRAQFETVRKETEEAFAAILTDEQMVKYRELNARRMRGPRGGR